MQIRNAKLIFLIDSSIVIPARLATSSTVASLPRGNRVSSLWRTSGVRNFFTMSVSTTLGAIALTRMPCAPSSRASPLVSATTAALLAPYQTLPKTPPPLAADPEDPSHVLLRGPTEVRSVALVVLTVLAVLATLKWASAFLIPVMVGVMFSYALSPIVDQLERLRIRDQATGGEG